MKIVRFRMSLGVYVTYHHSVLCVLLVPVSVRVLFEDVKFVVCCVL